MKRLVALVLFAAVLMLPACRESDLVVGRGTTHASGVECSAWYVRADTGREYQLHDLAPEFQQNGLRVRFTLHRRGGYSTCMYGEIVDIVWIARL